MRDRGHFDIRPHQEMWDNFARLMTGSIISAATVLVLLAI